MSQAGSIVGFLIDRDGIAAMKERWQRGPAGTDHPLGADGAAIEAAWLARVKRATPATLDVPRLIRESGQHPEIANLLDTVIHTRRLAYRRVVNRAIARHELGPDVDQDLLIDLLIGPIWTRLLITHDPITETLIDEIVDAITRAFPAPSSPADADGRTRPG